MPKLTRRSVRIVTAFVIGAIWSPLLMRSETMMGVIAAVILGAAIVYLVTITDAGEKGD